MIFLEKINYLKENKELMKEYNYEKNKSIDLESLKSRSGKTIYWTCKKCGGSWIAPVARRTAGSKCPYCSNRKVLKGYNDLATKFPNLVSEWNYEKNGQLIPEQFHFGSTQKVWWKCSKGHSYFAKICDRTKDNYKCPYCSNSKILEGFNDLKTKYPNVAKEWDYEKNGNITPKDIIATSNKKVWWKCSKCGHEWQTLIATRTIQGCNCPVCARKKA